MVVLFPEKGANRVSIGLEKVVCPWQESGACWDRLRVPRLGDSGGGGLRIPHLNGIIISPVAKVGADCTIFHQVTLGVNGRKSLGAGPTLGDRVSIGTGAKIIGPVRIGDDVTIGANAVVTKDIPNGATVVGFNKVIREEPNGRGTSE